MISFDAIEEVRVLRVEPGDTVILRTLAHISQDEAAEIAGKFRTAARVPDTVSVIVLGEDASIEVIRP